MRINTKTFLTYSLHHCPPSKDEKKSDERSHISTYDDMTQKGNCYLDHETQPLYRHVKKRFNFFMTMRNELKLPNGTYPDYEIDYPIIKHYEIGKLCPQY